MTAVTRLELDSMPSATTGFLKAAIARRGGLKNGQTIPRIEAVLHDVAISSAHVRRYAALCGYGDARKVPGTYPHVLAAPMHLKVLTHPNFPLKLPGLVHIRNDVRQHRPIGLDETVTVLVHVDGHREVHNGLEFDLCTRIEDKAGALVWESASTNLLRQRSSGGKKPGSGEPDLSGLAPRETWQVSASIGRRYGLAAGDVNPIHMHNAAAKLFGFPRAIAHGMWSFARCIAALDAQRELGGFHADVAFRKPILLPSSVVFRADDGDAAQSYAVIAEKGDVVHLTGRLERG